MIIVLVGLFVMTIHRYNDLKDAIGEDKMWAVMQLDREARKLSSQLNTVVTARDDSPEARETLRLRYDILYSRVKILTDGPFAAQFTTDQKSKTIVEEVNKTVTSFAGLFDSLDHEGPLPREELSNATDVISNMIDQCEQLVSFAAFAAADNVSDQRASLFRLQITSAIVSAILAGSIFLMNVLQKRHLRHVLEAKAKVDILASALQAKVVEAVGEIRDREEEIIGRLAVAAGHKDSETESHTRRVAAYSEAIARSYGLDDERSHDIKLASLMHDIGKVGIPDSILQKRGPLTPSERSVMNAHTTTGGDILKDSKAPLLQLAADIARSHHERWDGTGYPAGLSGDNIPLAGRIVALADNFDALTSTRPYKVSWTTERAIEYIRNGSGSHFDPECVAAFEKILPVILGICYSQSDASAISDAR